MFAREVRLNRSEICWFVAGVAVALCVAASRPVTAHRPQEAMPVKNLTVERLTITDQGKRAIVLGTEDEGHHSPGIYLYSQNGAWTGPAAELRIFGQTGMPELVFYDRRGKIRAHLRMRDDLNEAVRFSLYDENGQKVGEIPKSE